MTANTTLNTGTGGDVIATDDLTTAKAQRIKLMLGATGVDGGNVTSTNPLPVSPSGSYFTASAGNTSAVQLAAGAIFTGSVESVFNQQSISILLTSDQPGTLTLKQYIDAGGTRLANTQVFTNTASSPLSFAIIANGNYFQAIYQNTGSATTTTFNLDVAYGTIDSMTNLGNKPVAIAEYGGAPLSTSNALPVQVTNTPNVNLATLGADPAYAFALLYAELKLQTQILIDGLGLKVSADDYRTDPSYLQ